MLGIIKKIFTKFPFYFLLIPVFFALHSYAQYFGLVTRLGVLKTFIGIECTSIVLFFVLLFFIKKIDRSAHIVALLLSVFLFFGAIKNFVKSLPGVGFISKYSFFLPLIFAAVALCIWLILLKEKFERLNRFLNTLLLVFLCIEFGMLAYYDVEELRQGNQMLKNTVTKTNQLPDVSDKPDVYYLVFDSYPGTGFLKDHLQYNNTALDSSLRSLGFYVAAQPRSNYNRTAFSIASELNFEYLKNVPDQSKLEPSQYNQASLSIAHAAVPAIFNNYGYKLYNLSTFDLSGQPSFYRENFLVLPEDKMLLYNTFFEKMKRDVLWDFKLRAKFGESATENTAGQKEILFERGMKQRDFNNRLIDSLPAIVLENAGKPKFTYAHFYLPHPPFFYDANGVELTIDPATVEKLMEQRGSFLSYLEYTNKVLLETVKLILKNSGKPPVIIVQSDHGYRDFRQAFVKPMEYFKNYSSFYFPDHNYTLLYDSISNINTFPVIFNKYFKTNIPLRKDESIFTGY